MALVLPLMQPSNKKAETFQSFSMHSWHSMIVLLMTFIASMKYCNDIVHIVSLDFSKKVYWLAAVCLLVTVGALCW